MDLDRNFDFENAESAPSEHAHLAAAHDRSLHGRNSARNPGQIPQLQLPRPIIHLEIQRRPTRHEQNAR